MHGITHSSLLLATTLHYSELVGWPVWVSLVTGVIGALLTTGGNFPSKKRQLRLRAWLPLLMLIFCFLSHAGGWIGYYQRDHLAVAFVISFAFGAAFTLDALRAPHLQTRACGMCNAMAYGLLAIAVADSIR